tara:strand:- start:157 stop:327 length:171 start_codon:yes stop_codon:yes gene_type:complete
MTRVYKVQMFLEASEQGAENVGIIRISEKAPYALPPCVYIEGGITKIFSTISLRSF